MRSFFTGIAVALALAGAALGQPTGGGGGVSPVGSAGGDLGGSYPSPTVVSVSHVTSGVLGAPDGGTGQSSFTNGQLLIGDTGTGGLDKATLTAGANVTITNTAGGITIAASGGGGGTGCLPAGAAGQPLSDSGSGSCISNSVTTDGVLYSNGSSGVASTAAGTAGNVLTSNGSGVAPTFQAPAGGSTAIGETFIAGSLTSANMNSTADQSISLTSPSGATNWVIDHIIATNCSGSVTTAKGGFYAATSKSSPMIGSTTSVWSNLATTNTAAITFPVPSALATAPGDQFAYYTSSSHTMYLSLTTAQGATMTCDIYVIGLRLS